ncbi:MAG: septum formation initiator family protein [Actinomycetota bacterium]|nr:septum formation initiator family protein [Actinomycetota bacterium]
MGRIGLLLTLGVVGALYAQHALELLSTHSQAQQQLAIVRRLERSNAALIKKRDALGNPATIQREARSLGMVRLGERPYVVTGRRNP